MYSLCVYMPFVRYHIGPMEIMISGIKRKGRTLKICILSLRIELFENSSFMRDYGL